MKITHKSPSQPYNPNGGLTFEKFIDIEGAKPNSKTVIDGFWLHATLVVTVATASQSGEDLARAFGATWVTEVDGFERWRGLTGDQSRIASIGFEGSERLPEHADLGVGAGTINAVLWIPMRKRFAKKPGDYSMLAETFRSLKIQCPGDGEFTLGGSTLAITAAGSSYYVIAECHEEVDPSVKVRDYVSATLFTSPTQTKLDNIGKIHDMYLHARGAAGGASLANFTSIRATKLQNEPILCQTESLAQYRRKRARGNNSATQGGEQSNDPFTSGKAIAVMMSDEDTSFTHGPVIDGTQLNADNSVADVYALTRTIVPRSNDIANLVAARNEKSVSQFGIDTASGKGGRIGKTDAAFAPLRARR